MVSRMRSKTLRALVLVLAALALIVLACAPLAPAKDWSAVLAQMPGSGQVSQAPPTALDGTYTKFTFKDGSPVPCSYCPEYASELDLWKLNLDRGVFRIFHELTGEWTVGSFAVTGEQLTLSNDPHCPDISGVYTWKLQEGKLFLSVIQDDCSAGLRMANLAGESWFSCQPPNEEAAITQHWPAPLGCY